MSKDPVLRALSAIGSQGALSTHLTAALAEASDSELRRVVGVVDGLSSRAGVDHLLAGIRPRIAELRPPRPLRFGRLLVLPLEVALVTPETWLRSRQGIPRSTLAPIIQTLRAALGTDAEEIEHAALGFSTGDVEVVATLGARLWPAAAGALIPPVPEGWERTRLPPQAAAQILAVCRALWRDAAANGLRVEPAQLGG
ncbi:hypothetical protein [Falsiroseomonas oryziterrae]|uniref:hypothetical protein n=1 Tax=Falsiroseomonas oryziterrae TaxID=2911368 RepID=UPI001F1AA79D|nr:hypothetical protein [Roseomonas sp. NPKOSM-4]